MSDVTVTNKSDTLPASGHCRILYIIAHPSIRVASGIIFLNDTSTFNAFFKSAFDVGHLLSLVSLNKAVSICTI